MISSMCRADRQELPHGLSRRSPMRTARALILKLADNSRSQAGYVRVREVPRKVHMPILDKIAQEKQRVSERLARLDMERARLSQELGELEIAGRLLTEFGRRGMRTERRRRASL